MSPFLDKLASVFIYTEAPDELIIQISVIFASLAGWQKEHICFKLGGFSRDPLLTVPPNAIFQQKSHFSPDSDTSFFPH